MSLRQSAKILGVQHSTLSKCINGQREWNPELKPRYDQLVSTLPESGGTSGCPVQVPNSRNDGKIGVSCQYGGAEEARTPDPLLARYRNTQFVPK